MNRPEEIALRLVTYTARPTLTVLHDGIAVAHCANFGVVDEPEVILKSCEAVLQTLGYQPDVDGMYVDMALQVLKFRRDQDRSEA